MAAPITTVVPFTSTVLPSCATSCGPLYDANGACVPPAAATAAASVYDACFCSYSKLTPFYSTTGGVCDNACTADASGLSSIQHWFTSFCSAEAKDFTNTASTAAATSTSSSSSHSSAGATWLSSHWKWVIFIIVIVVAIAGIWIGACIWRRKYLKRKDRMYELGKGLPSSVAVNTQGHLVGPGVQGRGQPGAFMSSPPPMHEKPKKERKKWTVTQRT